MVWVVYSNTSGQILCVSSDQELAQSNAPDDHSVMEFAGETASVADSKKVQNGVLVDDPDRVNEIETFAVRSKRNELLVEEVDVIAGNNIRWNALSDAQRTEWEQYRQALLDVPQQSGFPLNVTWPTKPS
tara:strand:- start:1039 stop:1428 length:390 start_codon:yes stop_codon:yes gene_type:complete